QAEDGIRDFHVTGVQTCALPISPQQRRPASAVAPGKRLKRPPEQPATRATQASNAPSAGGTEASKPFLTAATPRPCLAPPATKKIGRASCRESVDNDAGAGTVRG